MAKSGSEYIPGENSILYPPTISHNKTGKRLGGHVVPCQSTFFNPSKHANNFASSKSLGFEPQSKGAITQALPVSLGSIIVDEIKKKLSGCFFISSYNQ